MHATVGAGLSQNVTDERKTLVRAGHCFACAHTDFDGDFDRRKQS